MAGVLRCRARDASPAFRRNRSQRSAAREIAFGADQHSPALPRPRSPVDLFRQLLAMTPEEREIFLTNRPPEIREAHSRQGQRISRRSTPTSASCGCEPPNCAGICCRSCRNRPATAPRGWRRSRRTCANWSNPVSSQWIILPPQLQQEFLENEQRPALFCASGRRATARLCRKSPPPGSELARWTTHDRNATETNRHERGSIL